MKRELREPILTGKELDPLTNDKIPPFFGQQAILAKVNQLVERVKRSELAFPHTLLIGEEGMGKRTLALNIAGLSGAKLPKPVQGIQRAKGTLEVEAPKEPRVMQTSGQDVGAAGDLIGIITNLGKGDFLVISDIHQMRKVVVEFLYPAMEMNTIDFVIDKGPYAKTIKFILKPFTLIATLPDESVLDRRLRDAFTCVYKLEPYSKAELREIFLDALKSSNAVCGSDALDVIAETSEGNPRRGVSLCRKVAATGTANLTESAVRELLDLTEHNLQGVSDVVQDRYISDDVKQEVWRRDGGKCTKCGSQKNLEYDHIIPVSKGGSNTARNVQLLCEECNRKKGVNI